MADLGLTVNIETEVLNWLLYRENSELAFRELVSDKATSKGIEKVYRGNMKEFLENYLKPKANVAHLYPDRDETNKELNRNKILKALQDYKNRKDINEDTFRLTNISTENDIVIVKMLSEDLGEIFPPGLEGIASPTPGSTGVNRADGAFIDFDTSIEFPPTGIYHWIVKANGSPLYDFIVDEEGGNTSSAISIINDFPGTDNKLYTNSGVAYPAASVIEVTIDRGIAQSKVDKIPVSAYTWSWTTL